VAQIECIVLAACLFLFVSCQCVCVCVFYRHCLGCPLSSASVPPPHISSAGPSGPHSPCANNHTYDFTVKQTHTHTHTDKRQTKTNRLQVQYTQSEPLKLQWCRVFFAMYGERGRVKNVSVVWFNH